MNDIDKIKEFTISKKIQFTNHAILRLSERNINILQDIVPAILSSEIIEEYPKDYPYKSFLLLGKTHSEKPLHIVCALSNDVLWIITGYFPNNIKWNDDFKTRKER